MYFVHLKHYFYILSCWTRFEISINKNKSCSTYLNNIFIIQIRMLMEYIILIPRDSSQITWSHSWHCHLGHINETHISKQGSLGSFNLESYETCESCLSGEMTKSPYSRKGERASELLELIHSDVCSPMNTCTWRFLILHYLY